MMNTVIRIFTVGTYTRNKRLDASHKMIVSKVLIGNLFANPFKVFVLSQSADIMYQ